MGGMRHDTENYSMNCGIQTVSLSKVFKHSAQSLRKASLPEEEREVAAVDSVTLKVNKGEIACVLGPNGSGKTTLLKLLATLLIPTEGSASVNGFDISKEGAKVRDSIGLNLSEARSFYWRLTGRQNLEFFAALHNISRDRTRHTINYLSELLDIDRHLDSVFFKYSTGIKQKFCIARSLLHDPEVLLMDEPTKSLDQDTAKRFRDFIKQQLTGEWKKTVLFTSHNREESVLLSDRCFILKEGKITGSLNKDGLRDNNDIIKEVSG